MTTRSLPASLAQVVEELELRQPKVVTKKLLAEIIGERGINIPVQDVSERLQRHGWLLSLRTQGSWEFAPGARAGALGSGDRLIELRATLLRRPRLRVAVAYESAAWLHGLARRPPERDVLAMPSGVKPPPALQRFRITRHWGRLDPAIIDNLPVWRIETLVVLMGEYPMAFRSWPTVGEWLSEAATRVGRDLVLRELVGRRRSTWARTGYILETGGRYDLGELLSEHVPARSAGPVYLGSRRSPGRYDRRWNVRDSILGHRDRIHRGTNADSGA